MFEDVFVADVKFKEETIYLKVPVKISYKTEKNKKGVLEALTGRDAPYINIMSGCYSYQ
jgi:hypothetical protein